MGNVSNGIQACFVFSYKKKRKNAFRKTSSYHKKSCDGVTTVRSFFPKRTMFLGEYQHSIDEKGRLAVPMKFRGELAQGAVVTRGLDSSLFLLPLEEWGKLAEKLASLPLGQANSRAFARLMLAGAMEASLDKQGRFIIPDYLRAYASIKKHVVIVGINTRLEIWDFETWEQYRIKTEQGAVDIAERLGEFGI